MSRSLTNRQLARTLCQSVSRPSSIPQTRCATIRLSQPFSSSSSRLDDERDPSQRRNLLAGVNLRFSHKTSTTTLASDRSPPPARAPPQPAPKMSALAAQWDSALAKTDPANMAIGRAVGGSLVNGPKIDMSSLMESNGGNVDLVESLSSRIPEEPYHFHIYSHKHNCHVTVTKPNRDPILSLSNGNLGFKKSNRKHYDSAYQLGAYAIDKLQQQGWHNKIEKMEVCLRGFGTGREAVTKVLLGNEGRLLRDKIVKVSDSTRLKFGGTRSKGPRRL